MYSQFMMHGRKNIKLDLETFPQLTQSIIGDA